MMFHDGQRQLQDAFDTRRLADTLEEKIVRDVVSLKQKAFIESADMLFLATADAQGRPSCTYRGGEPGFCRVIDEKTIALPNYDGNGMYYSWGNVEQNSNVGLLFIDFMKGWRLRVHGEAHISLDDPLMRDFVGAEFVVRIRVREIFGNCPRYIHKYELKERSSYVPHAETPPAVPEWKKQPDMQCVLSKNDPARKT